MENKDKVYIDEPCVVSFFCGEMGWFLQRYQGHLRFLKNHVYPDRKFILMINQAFHAFVHDFVYLTIDLPKEFYESGLETDCYEAPLPDSEPGSLTPPEVWESLIRYFRNFYNPEKAIEFWTPRGCNTWIDNKPQLFAKYLSDEKVDLGRDIICVYPRGRGRANFRNVPEFVWKETVDRLKENFVVVLCGTKSGSYLADYESDNVINLIQYEGDDKIDKIITYLNNSVCSVGSQSGLTHVSLLSCCPSYIIGHEKERHAVAENRFGVHASFRVVQDYRAIDTKTICEDIAQFLQRIMSSEQGIKVREINNLALSLLQGKHGMVGVKIGVSNGDNIIDSLHALSINKLYVIGKPNKETKEKLEAYTDRIVWVEDGNLDIIENGLDFIYSDYKGQNEETIAKYIYTLYPKLKDDGVVAGNRLDLIEVQRSIGMSLVGKRILEVNTDGREDIDWIYKKKSKLRQSLHNLKLKKDLVGAEIGVYDGENARIMLKNLDIKKLYLIDPYINNVAGFKDKKLIERIKTFAHLELRDFKDKIEFIEKPSEEAINEIKEKLDFVYIDGNHTYEYVKKDIELYSKKVKENGLIAGHDYENKDVTKAVHEFAKANSLVVATARDVEDERTNEWWYRKDDINDYDEAIKKDTNTLATIIDKVYNGQRS